MKLNFLGTNGWYSTDTGNVVCTLLETKKYYIVFDAGDGIYKLGRYIKSNKPIYLLLSHLHLDHIFGFHIFPGFKFKNKFHIFCPKEMRKDLQRIIRHPFMMPLGKILEGLKIKGLSRDCRELPFAAERKKLYHIDPAFGYRVEIDGKTIAYCCDTGVCENSVRLARNADVLIHECSAKPGFISGKWGHANPQEAARIARKSNAKKLILTHFSPGSYNKFSDRLKAQKIARKIFKGTVAAKDGLSINV